MKPAKDDKTGTPEAATTGSTAENSSVSMCKTIKGTTKSLATGTVQTRYRDTSTGQRKEQAGFLVSRSLKSALRLPTDL